MFCLEEPVKTASYHAAHNPWETLRCFLCSWPKSRQAYPPTHPQFEAQSLGYLPFGGRPKGGELFVSGNCTNIETINFECPALFDSGPCIEGSCTPPEAIVRMPLVMV